MSIKKKIKENIEKIIDDYYIRSLDKVEKRKMKDRRRVKEYESVQLSEKQKHEIDNYFEKNYGKKIDDRWHRMYQSFTGIYNKEYFPEILFSTKLEPLMNNKIISNVLADKSMLELLYNGIDGLYIPKTIVLCCSGIYYDENRNIITKDEAFDIIKNCGKKIIKKIIDSCSGQGVLLVDFENGVDKINNNTIEKTINEFGNNYIIQELVKNSNDISRIYDKSLNTFRIVTYTIEGKLYHVPIAMRIGKSGNNVDNIHAGGLFIGCDDDGNLMDTAYTEFQDRYKQHPDSKIVFKGYKIKNIDKMIKIAYKCHGRTPHLRLISWDFTINDNNQVTLIEANLNNQSIWFPQMANGKAAFGTNTEYILNLIKNVK